MKETNAEESSKKELEELKSEIKLMKEVIVALAKITVDVGFNCTYPEKNEFYKLVSKMFKEKYPMNEFDIDKLIKVDEWLIQGTNFNISIRHHLHKGSKELGEDNNNWALYATIFSTHPLFEKACKNKKDYDLELGNELYSNFHGGCTYYNKQRDYVKIGCDYNHIYDELFQRSTELPSEIVSDAKDLFDYMNSFEKEE